MPIGAFKLNSISKILTSPPPTYSVVSAGGVTSINEGSSLTFNVTTTNVANGTTLYWTNSNSTDFSITSGSFIINSNAGSFSVTPTADSTTEGAETFTVSVRTVSTSGDIVATSSIITINDTSQAIAPGGGTSPSTASAPGFTFGSAATVSSVGSELFDTSCVFSNADSSSGAYGLAYGTTSGMVISNIRHTTRVLTVVSPTAVQGSATPVKRSYCSWGYRTGGNWNKRGYTASQNSSLSRVRNYVTVTSVSQSTTAASSDGAYNLLGEMPATSSRWHEWTISLSGSNLVINRYGAADTATWHNTPTTYTATLAFTPMYEFIDTVKTSPVGTVSFWYGASNTAGYKDVLIIYSEDINTHIVNTANTFGYSTISSSTAKKGVLLSANINQTNGINAIAHWDSASSTLDLKLFTVATSPSLSATFGNKYSLSMSGETNLRLMSTHLGCDFCYLISTNSGGTSTYIRKLTATGINGLTISSPYTLSTTSGTTEVCIGNRTNEGILVRRSGTTIQANAFTNT